MIYNAIEPATATFKLSVFPGIAIVFFSAQSFCHSLEYNYRHSVGLGICLTSPVPVKIDWGFKIEPRKDRQDRSKDENASEVHFSMSYDW